MERDACLLASPVDELLLLCWKQCEHCARGRMFLSYRRKGFLRGRSLLRLASSVEAALLCRASGLRKICLVQDCFSLLSWDLTALFRTTLVTAKLCLLCMLLMTANENHFELNQPTYHCLMTWVYFKWLVYICFIGEQCLPILDYVANSSLNALL